LRIFGLEDSLGDLLDRRLITLPISKNSMLYWWYRVYRADVPKPRTFVLRFDHLLKVKHVILFEACYHGEEEGIEEICNYTREVLRMRARRAIEIVEEEGLGYPVFMRTDHVALKHDRTLPYRVNRPEEFYDKMKHFIALATPSRLRIPEPRAFFIREWIEPETWIEQDCCSLFKDKPYNRIEVRTIVRDGKFAGAFPYYHINGMLQNYYGVYEDTPWSYIVERYREYAKITVNAISKLKTYAELIGKEIDGSWSIDFMLSKNGEWYFIDMALEEDSWKPPTIDKLPKEATRVLRMLKEED